MKERYSAYISRLSSTSSTMRTTGRPGVRMGAPTGTFSRIAKAVDLLPGKEDAGEAQDLRPS